MPLGLTRHQQKGHLHFITFSCYRRLPYLNDDHSRITFEHILETLRKRHRFHVLAEALACLFHALLLHKIGMPRDVLTKLMTKSIIAERLIKPALGEVGLEIASDKT